MKRFTNVEGVTDKGSQSSLRNEVVFTTKHTVEYANPAVGANMYGNDFAGSTKNTYMGMDKKQWGWLGLGATAALALLAILKRSTKKKESSQQSKSDEISVSHESESAPMATKVRKKRKKVSPQMTYEWKQLAQEGRSRREIAKKYGVSKAAVDKHLKTRSYTKH